MNNTRPSWVLAALVGACCPAAGPASAQVQFRAGADVGRETMSSDAVDAARTALVGQHAVAQFESTPTPDRRAVLAGAGLTLLAPLGDHAYFVRVGTAALSRGAAINGVTSLRPVAARWKLSPMLAPGSIPPWAIVPGGTGEDPVIGVYVALHDDEPIDAAAEALVTGVGGVLRDVMLSVNGMVVELPLSAVRTLAASDRVMWIEPALPRLAEVNAENRALTGADIAQSPPYGLSGADVTALVYDSGTALDTHVDFQNRLTRLDSSAVADHATHVAGTIGGAGVATFNNRGMAPGVRLLSAGLTVTGAGQFLYNNPGDIEADYAAAIAQGASVANNSIGTNVESNGLACALQGDYGLTDRLIDQIARGGAGGPMIICWAAGNERQGTRCNTEGFGPYYSIAPPAGAKNHLSIGAVNADDDSMTYFSSWGPTDDGRMIPTFCAPGCQLTGDGGVTSCISTSNTAYGVFCGTSMATPTVTGLVALLLQDYRTHHPGQADPTGAMVKSLLAHTAIDRGNAGPDYQFGYGSVRIVPAIDFARTGNFLSGQVSQGSRTRYRLTLPQFQPELKVTLAWDDVPATPNSAKVLVNDLDLVLIDPSGSPHFAWTLDPAHPADPAVRTAPNHLDNIEQVVVDGAPAGDWYVEVRGYDVAQGPQSYSLVGVPPGAPMTSASISVTSAPAQPMAPGSPFVLNAHVSLTNDTLTQPPELRYRFQPSGPFMTAPMSSLGGNDYAGTIPAPRCGETVQYFVAMTTQSGGSNAGEISDPFAGAAAPYTRSVGAVTTIVNDNFNTDTGWKEFSSPQLPSINGRWERGVPLSNLTRGEPTHDYDGSGKCWVTGNVALGDVDGGPTILTSPTYDLSHSASPVVSFAQWMYTTGDDVLVVQISTDAGLSWPTTLETVTNGTGWRLDSFVVPASDKFRIRFSVADNPNDSATEAGVDAFKITDLACGYWCPADVDRSGSVDLLDFFAFFNAWDVGGPDADVDGVPGIDLGDFFAFFNSFDQGCQG